MKFDSNKLLQVEKILKEKYNSPGYNNKEKMIDEIIYIILSKRTNYKMNNLTYNKLKKKFKEWSSLRNAEIDEIYPSIKAGGLGEEKSRNILKTINKIYLDYGTLDIDNNFQKKTKNEVLKYLLELPGIGLKSALCIMLFSLKFSVQPADAHIIRIFYRLGAIDYDGKNHQKSQRLINNICSDLSYEINYSIHVNFKAHGESICKSINPKCNNCKIKKICEYFNS